MRYTTYRYNSETCQYERVKINAGSIIWYCLGLAVMSSCMLVGILLLHDFVINTPNESRLRKENNALRKHHALLSSQLHDLRPILTSLEGKDRVLHAKFFGSLPVEPPAGIDRASKQDLLLADADSFRDHIATLRNISATLKTHSLHSNYYYGDKFRGLKVKREAMPSFPTLQPVQPWEPGRLISGFGLRVNPFHKGLYKHLGIDIAMPRGTPVIATASGVISQLKRSDLQAGYGNYVDVDHGNGLITRYAHLEDIHVKYGTKIAKGQPLGTVGTSGGSVAPHLHYEIIRDEINIDPVLYMVQGLSSAEHHLLTVMSHQQNQSLD